MRVRRYVNIIYARKIRQVIDLRENGQTKIEPES